MSGPTDKLHIFITGATGYIGGCVLQLLLDHPRRERFVITAYVRNAEKAKKLEEFGVHTALGTLDDLDKLEDLASQANVILNVADSDHLKGNVAIFNGVRKRFKKTGEVSIVIHTSGTGLLTDDARGLKSTDIIYYDSNAEQINSLPPTAFHRNVDLEVIALDEGGHARTYIILPGTVYGIATGKLVDAGVMNRRSMQVPDLIRASLDRGQGGVVGEGKNVWPNVEINDTADLFIILFEAALAHGERPVPHGREGYFFAENGEHEMIDVSRAVAKALYELGLGKSPEPTPFTDEEIMKYFGNYYFGTNSRARGVNSRALGWKPVKTTADFLASIKPEVESILADRAVQVVHRATTTF